MKIWQIVLMFLFLSPAVFAVGLLIPTEFDSLVKVYTNRMESIDVKVKGDSTTQTVTFFARSPSPLLLINGVQNFSTSFTLQSNQIRTVNLQFTGINDTADLTVEYGFILGTSSSSGIGFQQVTKDTFKAHVYCVGSCLPSTGSGGSGTTTTTKKPASSGNAPVRVNSSNNTQVQPQPIQPINSNEGPIVGPPIIDDLAGENAEVNVIQTEELPPRPVITTNPGNVIEIDSGSVGQVAGRQVALLLVGMFISVLVLETVVYRMVRRMPD